MFLAAPRATGMEIKIPTTVEATVIHRLSKTPSTISSQREIKSGGANPAKNFCPRGKPSQTRIQLISNVLNDKNK